MKIQTRTMSILEIGIIDIASEENVIRKTRGYRFDLIKVTTLQKNISQEFNDYLKYILNKDGVLIFQK